MLYTATKTAREESRGTVVIKLPAWIARDEIASG